MLSSRIDAAKAYGCPDCGVSPGDVCWPRQEDDSSWAHTTRVKLMEMNTPRYARVVSL